MLEAKRTVRHVRRRTMSAPPRRRVYVGSVVTHRATSRFFLARTTQQVTSRKLLGDCFGAAVTLVGMAGWTALLLLLGA